jgi:hypothetical protein
VIVSLSIARTSAGMPPNRTSVTWSRFDPVMVTDSPAATEPLAGLNAAACGLNWASSPFWKSVTDQPAITPMSTTTAKPPQRALVVEARFPFICIHCHARDL